MNVCVGMCFHRVLKHAHTQFDICSLFMVSVRRVPEYVAYCLSLPIPLISSTYIHLFPSLCPSTQTIPNYTQLHPVTFDYIQLTHCIYRMYIHFTFPLPYLQYSPIKSLLPWVPSLSLPILFIWYSSQGSRGPIPLPGRDLGFGVGRWYGSRVTRMSETWACNPEGISDRPRSNSPLAKSNPQRSFLANLNGNGVSRW